MSAEPQDADLYNGRIDARQGSRAARRSRSIRVPSDAFFVCGPGTMIGDVTGALALARCRAARIHAEYFTPAVRRRRGPRRPRPRPAGQPRVAVPACANVTVLMDGRRRSFTMPTAGETLLDAAAAAGIDLPYSCRAGVCSTCRTRLARGEVEMDQNFALEDWELERGFILCCQAHPTQPEIELDYDERGRTRAPGAHITNDSLFGRNGCRAADPQSPGPAELLQRRDARGAPRGARRGWCRDGARVLVLTGAGRGFCAGQDLGDRAVAPGASGVDLGESIEEHYKPLVLALRALPMPVIAAVNGVAAGAGANIALACDLVIATRSATFIQAFAEDRPGSRFRRNLAVAAARRQCARDRVSRMLGDKLAPNRPSSGG